MIRRTNNRTAHKARPRSALKRSGAAMVEFAVIAPVMFAVVLGIVEFGRALMVSNLMTNAARDGARRATVDGATNTTVKNAVKQFLVDTAGVSAGDVTVTVTVDNSAATNQVANASAGDACTVKVEVPFSKVQFIAAQFLAGKSLKSQVTMRRE